jgi:hypothetical protein
MPSPSPSSTEKSDMSSSQLSSGSKEDHLTSTFQSYKDLSGKRILTETKDFLSQGIHYAANEDVASKGEFIYNKEIKGDIFIPKDNECKLSEIVLSGIFEIDARNFFLTSDGKWNVNNSLNTHFYQVKPSCHLLPVERDRDFNFSREDFPTIVTNLRQIEKLKNPHNTQGTYSCIVEEHGHPIAIKLSHHLFVVRQLIFKHSPY